MVHGELSLLPSAGPLYMDIKLKNSRSRLKNQKLMRFGFCEKMSKKAQIWTICNIAVAQQFSTELGQS